MSQKNKWNSVTNYKLFHYLIKQHCKLLLLTQMRCHSYYCTVVTAACHLAALQYTNYRDSHPGASWGQVACSGAQCQPYWLFIYWLALTCILTCNLYVNSSVSTIRLHITFYEWRGVLITSWPEACRWHCRWRNEGPGFPALYEPRLSGNLADPSSSFSL